jgi:hypothetical protein
LRRFLPLLGLLLFALPVKAQSLDIYGGRTDISCSVTGWFHTQKIGNRWWFCTPLGHAFFSQSVDLVLGVGNVAAKYGNTVPIWAEEEDLRLKEWGFNTIGYESYGRLMQVVFDAAFPADGLGNHSNPVRVPSIIALNPARDALWNPQAYLTEPVKDIVGAVSPQFALGGGFKTSNGLPDWYDSSIATQTTNELANDGVNTTYLNWVIGVEIEDGDQLNGFSESPDPAFPQTHTLENLGITYATMSPVQTADSNVLNGHKFVYANKQMYSKLAMRAYLVTKYTTVGALNTAWGTGGAYTTFDSSGMCVGTQPITCTTSAGADSVGTGDGTTLTFGVTLSHTVISNCSLQILVAGVPVAGEDSRSLGTLYGPNASGTINTTTGALSITFTAGHAPANAAAITATYIANGWQIGTGFLDEGDNATSQAWMGTDFIHMNGNAQVITDMNAFLALLSGQVWGTYAGDVHAIYPNLLFLGPNTLGAWGTVPPAPILQGAAPYLDAIDFNGGTVQLTTAMLDFVAANYGDKPIMAGYYSCANPDSAESGFNPCPATIPPAGGDFATQPLRGADYIMEMGNILTNTTTTSGTHPYVSMEWFDNVDFAGTNWGLVSVTDNAYDGSEPATGAVTCSGILGTVSIYGWGPFTCGSEPAPGACPGCSPANLAGTRPFGDVITSVKAANALWLALPAVTPTAPVKRGLLMP